MTWIAEDPLLVWIGGALLFTMALIAYLQLRTSWTVAAMAVVAALVSLLTLLEIWIVTPREAVERTVRNICAAVEANDLTKTLSYIAPAAIAVRADAQTLMPRLEIRKARVMDTPVINVDGKTASVNFRGFIDVTDKRSGMKGGYFDDLQVNLEHNGERWLVTDVDPNQPWRRRL